MISLEREGQIRRMGGHETGKWHSEVEAHRNFSSSIVFKMEDLFVCFSATFSKKNGGILQDRSVNWNKTIGLESFFQRLCNLSFRHFLFRHTVSEAFKDNWIYHIFS